MKIFILRIPVANTQQNKYKEVDILSLNKT